VTNTHNPGVLDPSDFGSHIDALYRAAWALCGSRPDAEDLVQETFAHVLKRRRVVRNGNARGYLLRALRNTYSSQYRARVRRPATAQFLEDVIVPAAATTPISSRELMEAIAAASPAFRDAVIAVDLLGLSYREAACWLRTGPDTIASRLHRGRQHVARELTDLGISPARGRGELMPPSSSPAGPVPHG
jgi:RNA polymerase sigma-70 factor, ECF subfamily